MSDIYHRPIAFTERESGDPITGDTGILRHEWRLVPFNSTNPLHRTISLHRQSAGRFTPTVILETRYIRRGAIEPWQVFDGYEDDNSALSDIDPKAISIDCPALIWIQHDRSRAHREYEAEQAALRNKEIEKSEALRLRGLSIDAWWKLRKDPRHNALCDEWNEFTSSPGAASLIPDLQRDPTFMRLYNLAHRGTITAKTKRIAMRECIDYYNFMWRHRERIESQPESKPERKPEFESPFPGDD